MTDQPPGSAPRSASNQERAAMGDLVEDVLPVLVARLRASRLGELEVGTDGWRVRLRREARAPDVPGLAGGIATGSPEPAAVVDRDEAIGEARSPAVGYFTPGRDVAVGRSVRAGDSLGTVDVLGIVQDVAAPGDGVIMRVLAEAGQAVEYGQPLVEIDPLIADPGFAAETVTD